MEIKTNEKGRGVYATRDFEPWEVIFTEDPVFPVSSINNPELETLAKNKDKYPHDSIPYKLLSFVSATPNTKIDNQAPQLKIPLLFLKSEKDINVIKHLAMNPKIKKESFQPN